MKEFNLDVHLKNKPEYDKEFIPAFAFYQAYQKRVLNKGAKRIALGIKRSDEDISVFDTLIHKKPIERELDKFYIERLVKSLLWMCGGHKIYVFGDSEIADYLKAQYASDGKRSFDYDFMSGIYDQPLEVISLKYSDKKAEKHQNIKVAKQLNGYRIGFDAGGSDIKVCAISNGEVLYSDEIVWNPKTQKDPEYHCKNIAMALDKASSFLPRVDAIGISSAGIYLNNQCKAASLFIKVPKDDFIKKVKDIYLNVTAKYPGAKVLVMNDGDVAAIAGAIGLEDNGVMGLAMGTSEAAGFIDKKGEMKGWLNELAFVPIDYNSEAMMDEWSVDIGCGVKYFSQDSAIKLASNAGIRFDDESTPAQKLRHIQDLLKADDERAKKVFESIGVYLGHTLPYYHMFYEMNHVLLMGRVISGQGGEIILKEAKRVISEEYCFLHKKLNIQLPDERTRRVGQSVAAASIPEVN